jgi:hypothetical protein
MDFVQVIEFTSDADAESLVAAEIAWRAQTAGRRTNVVEWFLVDRANPRHKFAINGFPSAEAAATNSGLPETDALSKQIGSLVDSDMRFVDCDFVDQAAEERSMLAQGLAEAIATGRLADNLVSDDVFFDMNVPAWRYQLQGVDTVRNMLAADVAPGAVEATQITPTLGGFVLELVTRDARHMYRQMCLVRTRGGLISEVALYCTGPWDSETEARQQADAPMIRRD